MNIKQKKSDSKIQLFLKKIYFRKLITNNFKGQKMNFGWDREKHGV
jgi:hypothetical protein